MSREAHPVEVDSILRIAQRRCEDLGVSVRFDWKAKTASTDGRSIVLPQVRQPITMDQLDILYGQVIHETGHHLRPDAFAILKAARPPKHLCALYNIVEDEGMERERALAWRGDAKALSEMNTLIVSELDATWQEHANLDEADGQDPAPLAALALNQLARLSWDPNSSLIAKVFIRHLPDHASELVNELVAEGWVDKLRATVNEKDTWNLAVDLAKRLYPDNEEQQDEYEEIREAGLQGMGGQRDDSDSSFEDSQSGTPTEGMVSDEADESLPEGEGRTVSWEDCIISEHTEWAKDQEGGPLGITWAGHEGSQNIKLAPLNLIEPIDLSKGRKLRGTGWCSYGGAERFMPTDQGSKAFAAKVRRYIQAQARSKIIKEREYGKIDRSNLYRLGMPAIDGGQWNKKIFYEQRKQPLKDTCIFVLVDWSGSMSGQKMKYAAEATQRLIHTFDRVLHVPVGCAAFTDRKSFCDIGYIKKFNTRNQQPEAIANAFQEFSKYTCGNNDADAVNWAYHEILKRKEKRKILIVLSDGAPAGSWAGADCDVTLKYITGHIEKDPRVDLYGVGIMDESVNLYYKHHQVVWKPEDITPALFNVIKEGDTK